MHLIDAKSAFFVLQADIIVYGVTESRGCGIHAAQAPVRECSVDILVEMVCRKSLEWVLRGRCDQEMTLNKNENQRIDGRFNRIISRNINRVSSGPSFSTSQLR